ncbi:MAG: S8 family peptidase [Candidatus Polarisedimenticolia bacterium]
MVLLLALFTGPQAGAQLGLLDPLLSTVEQLLSPLDPLVSSLLQFVGKLSGELLGVLEGPADLPVPVIVQTYSPPDSDELGLLDLLGGVLKTTHSSIPGYSATIPAGSLLRVASDPNVERISLDSPVRAHLDVAHAAVRADLAASTAGWWGAGLTGRGVGIALIDTGVQLHADFKRPFGSRPVLEVEIVGGEPGLADYFGHGSHVAGILYGNGAASSDSLSFRTFKGVAPGSHLISVRALAPDGSGYTSDILRGIDWVVRNARYYNIRVLNLSLGHPVYESYATDPLCRAVAAAVRKGIVVVVAAGNDGSVGTGFGTITSPGNAPSAITVGALDDLDTVTGTDDALAGYSSKGPSLIDYVVKPDLVAPGTWVVSTRAVSSWLDTQHHELTLRIGDYKNDPERDALDGAYTTLSGTSMAAPMVAGVAALMLQKEPTLDPATVKARLMKSAVKDTRLVFETGAGALDAYGAIHATGYAKHAASPIAMAGGDGYVYLQDTAQLWGSTWSQGAIWGVGKGSALGVALTPVPASITSASGFIWGGSSGARVLSENPEVTGSGAIWGGDRSFRTWTSGTVTGEGAIWGGVGAYRK